VYVSTSVEEQVVNRKYTEISIDYIKEVGLKVIVEKTM
jgi:hypothetical protein